MSTDLLPENLVLRLPTGKHEEREKSLRVREEKYRSSFEDDDIAIPLGESGISTDAVREVGGPQTKTALGAGSASYDHDSGNPNRFLSE